MVHIGFRAPVINGKAIIVSARVLALFGSQIFSPTVRIAALNTGEGILDLATIADGILILSGPVKDLARKASLFHFNDSTGVVKPIAAMVEPFDRRAQGLLVVEDDPEFFVFLVLFDGKPDGGPIEYVAPL